MTPDRHLGAAWIDRCRPDLLITETTYGTYVRDSKRQRERDFLKKVRVSGGHTRNVPNVYGLPGGGVHTPILPTMHPRC